MKVKVVLFSFLREKLGWKEKIVEVEGEKATLEAILDKLPDLKEAILSSDIDSFLILVDGVNVRLLKLLKTEVKDGTEIAIFPPGGGG